MKRNIGTLFAVVWLIVINSSCANVLNSKDTTSGVCGNGGNTSSGSVSSMSGFGAPQNVVCTVAGVTTTISWNAVTDAAKYYVHYKSQSQSSFDSYDYYTTQNTSYTFSSSYNLYYLYSYYIVAVDSDGNTSKPSSTVTCSSYSDTLSFSIGSNSITASWKIPTDDRYNYMKVYVASSASGSPVCVSHSDTNSYTLYTLPDGSALVKGSTYYFSTVLYDLQTNTEKDIVGPTAVRYGIPLTPNNFKITYENKGTSVKVTLTWDAVAGASSYYIFRTVTDISSTPAIPEYSYDSTSSTTYTESVTQGNKKYTYWIKAGNGLGESALTDSCSFDYQL